MPFSLSSCNICPFECNVDRNISRGRCGAGAELEISAWNLHHGEEPSISGTKGSGTIFFTHCALKCKYCQNYPISQLGNGKIYTRNDFINIILKLQDQGAHNINLVTPSHYLPDIIDVLRSIKGKNLNIPVVYNCSGYEKLDSLQALEGLIDIYMPDVKYGDNKDSFALSGVKNYIQINRLALEEMYRQVGNLRINSEGIAYKGLLIRHLILPNRIDASKKVLDYISEKFGVDCYLSLMAQYHPAYNTVGDESMGRRLNQIEYDMVLEQATLLGFKNIYCQDL